MCEEQEYLETGNDHSRKEDVEGEETFNQMNGEEAADDHKQEGKSENKGEEKDKVVSETELSMTKRDEKQVRSGMRTEEPQEALTKDNDFTNGESEDKEAKSLEEGEDQKRGRRRRGKKQVERAGSKRGFKGVSEKVETEKTGQTQEVARASPTDSSAMSEPTVGLMDSCDLSDPIYLGCGSSGLYCPPVPIPLLYSSHQPAPPQPQGTKRPHSPYLTHSLPQPNSQPLEVRILLFNIHML